MIKEQFLSDQLKGVELKDIIEDKLEKIPQNRKYIEFSKLIVKEVKKHIKKIYRPNCKICNIHFKDDYALKTHLRKVHKENPFVCSTCDQRYPFMKDLKSHIKMEHLKIDKEFELKFQNVENRLHQEKRYIISENQKQLKQSQLQEEFNFEKKLRKRHKNVDYTEQQTEEKETMDDVFKPLIPKKRKEKVQKNCQNEGSCQKLMNFFEQTQSDSENQQQQLYKQFQQKQKQQQLQQQEQFQQQQNQIEQQKQQLDFPLQFQNFIEKTDKQTEIDTNSGTQYSIYSDKQLQKQNLKNNNNDNNKKIINTFKNSNEEENPTKIYLNNFNYNYSFETNQNI